MARVLLCECTHYDLVPPGVKEQVLAAIEAAGVPVDIVPDLCGLAARRSPELQLIAGAGTSCIAACYPRAVRWLFHAAGATLPDEGVEFLNLREQPAREIISAICRYAGDAEPIGISDEGDSGWIPWFPVIDYDRCVGCRQCLDFCLFGTFVLSDDGRVEVANPSKCKTNCPACARVCPQAAIIFPKYKAPPINGDEVDDSQVRETVKVNASELAGGDVYARLRDRGRRRFATDGGDSARKRAAELARLQDKLGIPDEVIENLGAAPPERDCPCDCGTDPAGGNPTGAPGCDCSR